MNLQHAEWRKSTYSSANGGQCVEVAANLASLVAVRDSKDPDGGALLFTPEQWAAFLSGARGGRFDR
jgi:hypothetical protein